MKPWHIYILECSDGTLYTGITTDPVSRLEKHRSKLGAKYTRSRGVKKIVYQEELKTKSAALKREHEIKSLTRNKKIALIQNR